MKFSRFGSAFVVRLDRGEGIVASLESFAALAEIGAAEVGGIGAVDKIELKYFDIKNNRYLARLVEEELELLSLLGNLALRDGRPFAHLHAVLGRADGSTLGGHVGDSRVSVTCELVVRPLDGSLRREADPATGLALLDLPAAPAGVGGNSLLQ